MVVRDRWMWLEARRISAQAIENLSPYREGISLPS